MSIYFATFEPYHDNTLIWNEASSDLEYLKAVVEGIIKANYRGGDSIKVENYYSIEDACIYEISEDLKVTLILEIQIDNPLPTWREKNTHAT